MFFPNLKTTPIYCLIGSLLFTPSFAGTESLSFSKLAKTSAHLSTDVKKLGHELNATLQGHNDKNIWPRVQKGLSIPYDLKEPRIQAEIKRILQSSSFQQEIKKKAAPYLYFVLEEVERRGLPSELALIPFVESSYNPTAVQSKSGAAGLWQIMAETGKWFGLHRAHDYDGRHDIYESTRAALSHFSYLYKKFDQDWLLAVAAYNCGEGNVRKAIKKNKKAGLKTDFWSLPLPQETKRYVPKLLALAAVVKAPQRYQYPLPTLANKPYLAKIKVSPGLELSQAAQLAGVDVKMLAQLNAGYKQKRIPYQGPNHLFIPISQAKGFKHKLVTLEKTLTEGVYHVKPGDSLSRIAARYHISIQALQKANKLSSTTIHPNQRLVIPGKTAHKRIAKHTSPGPVTHVVRKGDSLWKISQHYEIPLPELMQKNSLKVAATLHPGQKLIIHT